MVTVEITILLVYTYIIIQVVSSNQRVLTILNEIDKDALEELTATENSNLKFTLFSSILGVGIFYYYLSFLSFLFFFLLTCILIYSFENVIRHLNKKGLENV